MFTFHNLTILGTHHVSAESANAIKHTFATLAPKHICVELDKGRLQGLLSHEKPKISARLIPRIGLFGFLFLLVGRYVQKKFGKIARLEPGVDMKTAVDLARTNGLRLGLIDRPIEQTLRRMSQQFTFKEKMRLTYDLTIGFIFGKKVKIDMKTVPDSDVLTQVLSAVKDRYPSFYNVLIDERDYYMAQRLWILHQKFPTENLLAVVGAGHEPGIKRYLELFAKQSKNNPPEIKGGEFKNIQVK